MKDSRPFATRPVVGLTVNLRSTYSCCGGPSTFHFERQQCPRRYLTDPSEPSDPGGFDNVNNDLILYVGMELMERYVVVDSLGSGAFGQVVLCDDFVGHSRVAVKVTKNHPSYFRQAQSELSVLHFLQSFRGDPRATALVQYLGYFVWAGHMCVVFEVLGCNLYELLKANNHVGLSLAAIRHILRQIISSMLVLQENAIVHCDIKPENILLVRNDDAQVRLIDFGSACHEQATVYTYIQSRYYRAPEVLCAAGYDCRIDVWSLGCVMAEMFLGVPLFPGVNEYHQMRRIIEMVGYPSVSVLHTGRDTSRYFKQVSMSAIPEPGFQDEYFVGPCDGFQLKSEEEYCRDTGTAAVPFRRYFNYRMLGDLIFHYPMPLCASEDEIQRERLDRLLFLDMLRGMLNPRLEERWRAHHIARHPFLCESTEWGGEGYYHRTIVMKELRAYDESQYDPTKEVLSPDAVIPEVRMHTKGVPAGHVALSPIDTVLPSPYVPVDVGVVGGGSTGMGVSPLIVSDPMYPNNIVIGSPGQQNNHPPQALV